MQLLRVLLEPTGSWSGERKLKLHLEGLRVVFVRLAPGFQWRYEIRSQVSHLTAGSILDWVTKSPMLKLYHFERLRELDWGVGDQQLEPGQIAQV